MKQVLQTKPTNNVDELFLERHREKVMSGTLMSNAIMTYVFNRYPEAIELIARIVLNDEKLKIAQTHAQDVAVNLYGRSAVFDVLATTANGETINIEIQNAPEGVIPERFRWYQSILDSMSLKKGSDYSQLPTTYIIFICARYDAGSGEAINRFSIVNSKSGAIMQTRMNYIVLDTSVQGDTSDIGKLCADMCQADPEKMHFEILAQPMRQIKNTEKGVLEMCKRYDETFLEGFEDGEKAGLKQGLEQGISQQLEKTVLRLIDRGETDVNVLIDITCSNMDAIQKILNKHHIVLASNA